MKNFLVRFIAVLLAFQGVVLSQLLTLDAVKAADAPEVVINEVMWTGSSSYGSDDDWIELLNTGEIGDPNGDIDISYWRITNASTSATETLIIPAGSIIESGQTFLISRFPKSSSVLDIDADWIANTETGNKLELDDTCEQIDLMKQVDLLVDSMGCGSNYFYPSNTNIEHALERNIIIENGTLASSWHERVEGSANLDALAPDLATPKVVNDVTVPNEADAIVNDGTAEDIDWSNSLDTAHANWDGFVDSESGLTDEYIVELYDSNGLIDDALVTGTSYTFTSLSLAEGEEYHFEVMAINGVNLVSAPAYSDGFTVDTTAPETPTNLVVFDTPADNGGSLTASWDASVSMDEITYQLNYRKVGEVVWNSVPAGTALTLMVSGLESAPSSYEFTVEAIDFSSLHSAPSSVVSAQALDNLAPVLTTSKVIVGQNSPTVADTIAGLSGAVNEPSTVNVFDRDPALPGAILLGSVVANLDGSFASISIGDNQHATVYLQVVDTSGNATPVVAFQNDIVAPTAATLHTAVATCQSETCRVELHWVDNGPDTVSFQVGYTVNGVEKRTLSTTANGIVLDLPTGNAVDFVVYATDKYGNESVKSNALHIQMTAGVKTTATYVNGAQVTTTEAIPGSREVIETTGYKNGGFSVAPPAKAAEPIKQDESSQTSNPVKDANDQDWSRIVIVVLILLAVAGGFYSLSRTFRDVPADEPIIPASKKNGKVAKSISGKSTKSKTKKRKR